MGDERRSAREPGRHGDPRSGSRGRDEEPVLPDVAGEDRDDAWGDDARATRRDDDWYRRERPPHHE